MNLNLNKVVNKQKNIQKLKVVQWNSNIMTVSRCEELNLLIKEIDPDIICLNEVKLDQHLKTTKPFTNQDQPTAITAVVLL